MILRMLYRNYKKHYSDCETVAGSYDKIAKSIEVVVPDDRMKPSGVRGLQFSGYKFWFTDNSGQAKYCTYRAVSRENAMRKHIKTCKQEGWTPCEPPVGKVDNIYR